jgi:hypothetical protein
MLKKLLNNVDEGIDLLQSLWGMIFRSLFIFAVGYLGYNWIDPPNIGDVPFAQLTLRAILGSVLAVGIVIGCIGWFFNFPDRMSKDEEDPYILWAHGSYYLIGIAAVAYFIWFRR